MDMNPQILEYALNIEKQVVESLCADYRRAIREAILRAVADFKPRPNGWTIDDIRQDMFDAAAQVASRGTRAA
jgi:hypothetical protein